MMTERPAQLLHQLTRERWPSWWEVRRELSAPLTVPGQRVVRGDLEACVAELVRAGWWQ